MQDFIQKCLFASMALISTTFIQAESIQFPSPGKYCFPQTSIDGGFDKIILNHNVIIDQEDYFKPGKIFIGFRRKSQPDVLWLTDRTSWYNAADYKVAHPVIFPGGDGILQPVMPVKLSNEPIDASPYVDDGEIWVGYGLGDVGMASAFAEMMDNQRFKRIWEIGGSTPIDGLPYSPTICLTTTGMEEVDLMVGIDPITEVPIPGFDETAVKP